jgi:hypothetical protein
MNDVIDELQASYTAHTSGLRATDAYDALILGATARGDGMRRARRRRRSGALAAIVVVVVAAASVAIAQRPDRRLRVVTTESTTGATATTAPSPTFPEATDREFPDLGRLEKFLAVEIARDAQPGVDVRAEVVRTTSQAFPLTNTLQAAGGEQDVPIYAVQLAGTTFVCHDCGVVSGSQPHGPSELFAWDPVTHSSRAFGVGAKPIDLSTFGRVYEIVFHRSPPAAGQDPCTQADLDGPGLAMPAPVRITSPVVLEPVPNYSHLDPAPGVVPKVSAAAAWSALTRNLPLPARSAQLLLGYWGTTLGGGENHVLAWVLRVQHLAFDGFQGGANFGTGPTLPQPACEFTNAALTLNATTGTGLLEQYGG